MKAKTTASMFATAAAFAFLNTAAPPVVAAGEPALVHCFGVNACRERGNCRSVENKCKGHNACKGQGYVPVTAEVCEQLGGVTRDE